MNNMNTQEIELQIPQPKPRSRKSTVFGRSPMEEDMIIPENSINNYPAPSTSSISSRSRQVSGIFLLDIHGYKFIFLTYNTKKNS